MLNKLTLVQRNVLIASIIGDGEITKLYPGSRRINNSYREHYGMQQMKYRLWKKNFMDGLLYLTPKSNTLRSRSSQLFTQLYPFFYNSDGQKKIPLSLLSQCTLPHFLAILYMDDGSLCITTRFNHNKKLIFLSPQIYLYLQNYHLQDLLHLMDHIKEVYNINLKIGKRKDSHGHILRTTAVSENFNCLQSINHVTKSCSSMLYKTDWNYRLQIEINKFRKSYPDYEVITSSSSRNKDYNKQEIERMILLKSSRVTDRDIANDIGRTYCSVVYKFSELRKQGRL